jgi:cytochrome b6-f complex iron-sulfur subunit
MGKDKAHTDNSKLSEGTSRRGFLKKLWIGLGVIAGIELSVVSMSFLVPGNRKQKRRNSDQIKVAGNVIDFKENTVSPFRDGKYYLIRMKEGGFLALSLKCSHLGCAVVWNESQKEFVCPCHASVFDMKGDVKRSPASRALDFFPVFIEEGMVKVDTGNAVRRNRFNEQQLVYA